MGQRGDSSGRPGFPYLYSKKKWEGSRIREISCLGADYAVPIIAFSEVTPRIAREKRRNAKMLPSLFVSPTFMAPCSTALRPASPRSHYLSFIGTRASTSPAAPRSATQRPAASFAALICTRSAERTARRPACTRFEPPSSRGDWPQDGSTERGHLHYSKLRIQCLPLTRQQCWLCL